MALNAFGTVPPAFGNYELRLGFHSVRKSVIILEGEKSRKKNTTSL